MTAPLQFAFSLHLHQPVGNFDSVFEQHLDEVYEPLIRSLDDGGTWPVTLHLSGPLLEWLEHHAPPFLDRVGRHVADGQIELLLSGFDEPVLAMLTPEDRREQIGRMREALRRRFGVEATGLWLTERVWEPDLSRDLVASGVKYVLVDDRHFLVTGFERSALHRWYTTEAGGGTLGVFPIDERLRYLVPFRPAAELAQYLRELRAEGHQLAILGDDGEKFGGWPGTREWVYEKGWMREFQETLRALGDSGEVRLVTLSQALGSVPSGGLAYLPTASYREMEGWALPPAARQRLAQLEHDLGDRLAGPDGALVRGTHWRNFLVKYPESNRMHKKMLAVSRLARDRGDPPEARRAIGKAQCNDAYWHGVFGGLYLPFLRGAIWYELARAEEILRAGEPVGADRFDLDGDGHEEIWIHSGGFSAIVAPARGGGIEEWTPFRERANWADTLTRRWEAYHDEALARAERPPAEDAEGGTASIHDIESQLVLTYRPHYDRDTRAILQERLLPARITEDDAVAGSYLVSHSWVDAAGQTTVEDTAEGLRVKLTFPHLEKVLLFQGDGRITAEFSWQVPPGLEPVPAWFSTELSLAREIDLDAGGALLWRYPIETVAKSERGLDRTLQGFALLLRWPVGQERARIVIAPRPA
jgi:alpha-amylase/alpha-mannosidase (GH57 family)